MKPDQRSFWVLLVNSMIVGLHPIIARGRPSSIDSLFFALATLGLEGLLIFPFSISSKKNLLPHMAKSSPLKVLPLVSLVGVIFGIASIILFFGMDATASSVTVALVLKTDVIYSLIAGRLIYHEKISKKQAVLGSLIFLGLGISVLGNQSHFSLLELALLIVPLLWLVGNILTKKLITDLTINSKQLVLGRTLVGAGLVFGVYRLVVGPIPWELFLIPISALFLFVNAIAYLFAHITWNAGIRDGSLSRAYQIKATTPVFTAIFSLALLGEQMTFIQIMGFTVVLISLQLLLLDPRLPRIHPPNTSILFYVRILDLKSLVGEVSSKQKANARSSWSILSPTFRHLYRGKPLAVMITLQSSFRQNIRAIERGTRGFMPQILFEPQPVQESP